MEFIKPKPTTQGIKTTWTLSQRTRAVVRYYAEYTGYTEDEVVDQFLYQLCEDPDFQNWLKQKRRNKRALAQIYGDSYVKGDASNA